jgi:hypothetical protein
VRDDAGAFGCDLCGGARGRISEKLPYWTRLRVGGILLPMTIILILAVALAAGVIIPSRWALLLPLAFGAGVAVMIAATGHAMDDTPIPFLVVVSTLVMVGGRGLRSRGRPQVL